MDSPQKKKKKKKENHYGFDIDYIYVWDPFITSQDWSIKKKKEK